MSDRELVADLLTKMPEDASLDVIADQIEFLAGIRRAREQARRGEVVSIEEVRKRIHTWAGQ
jgi:predicted transcriptional regulator